MDFPRMVKLRTYAHQQTLQKQNEEPNEGRHKFGSQQPAKYQKKNAK